MSVKTIIMTKILSIFALTALLIGAGSCAKEETKFPFQIEILGENGNAVQNAEVHAFVPLPNTDINFEGKTGIDGKVSFTHVGHEIIVQIQATKGDSLPAASGCGYLKLEPEELVTTTVVVSEYNVDDPGCM